MQGCNAPSVVQLCVAGYNYFGNERMCSGLSEGVKG